MRNIAGAKMQAYAGGDLTLATLITVATSYTSFVEGS